MDNFSEMYFKECYERSFLNSTVVVLKFLKTPGADTVVFNYEPTTLNHTVFVTSFSLYLGWFNDMYT